MKIASAPGKVFLLGEYAVLEGHGALVGAVDRRVRVAHESGEGVLRVTGSLLQAELRSETIMDALEGEASRVAAGVLASGRFRGGTLTVDSSALFEDGRKLGYGSSAAVVVAVAAALGHADFAACRRWHNRAQKTEGSGGDIAASLLGKVAWVQGDRVEAIPHVPLLAILHHPESASTPKLVGLAKQFKLAHPTKYDAHMRTLGDLAASARQALMKGDLWDFTEDVRDANEALGFFGDEAKIPIITPFHQEAAAKVEALEGAMKPAGAGGGDISLITAPDEATLNRIIDALKPHAERCVLAQQGVTITEA